MYPSRSKYYRTRQLAAGVAAVGRGVLRRRAQGTAVACVCWLSRSDRLPKTASVARRARKNARNQRTIGGDMRLINVRRDNASYQTDENDNLQTTETTMTAIHWGLTQRLADDRRSERACSAAKRLYDSSA